MLTHTGRGVVSVPLDPTFRSPCCACVELPNPTFWQRNLSSLKWEYVTHKVQKSAISVVGDKQQAGEG